MFDFINRINSILAILWPDGIQYDRVRVLYYDAAAYMVKAGHSLKIFYPNLFSSRFK
jgi:hypothetical protein